MSDYEDDLGDPFTPDMSWGAIFGWALFLLLASGVVLAAEIRDSLKRKP